MKRQLTKEEIHRLPVDMRVCYLYAPWEDVDRPPSSVEEWARTYGAKKKEEESDFYGSGDDLMGREVFVERAKHYVDNQVRYLKDYFIDVIEFVEDTKPKYNYDQVDRVYDTPYPHLKPKRVFEFE